MSISFLGLFHTLWPILSCDSCPQVNKPIYGMGFPPQNWLELNPWIGWAIVAAVAVMIPVVLKMLKE